MSEVPAGPDPFSAATLSDTTSSDAVASTEALRQQDLLRALVDGSVADGSACLAHPLAPAGQTRGLQAYQAHAWRVAERALAARYPTVRALIGPDAFGVLARAHWRAAPPVAGDLAEWGGGLPDALAEVASLRAYPYLADCARLDDLLAQADVAADVSADLPGLARLAEADPAQVRFRLAPGLVVLASAYPVATLWQAHHADDAEACEAALQAASRDLAAGRGEVAVVWRREWIPRMSCLTSGADRAALANATFYRALIQRKTLAEAWAAVKELAPMADVSQAGDFAFQAWLIDAIQTGRVVGVDIEPIAP